MRYLRKLLNQIPLAFFVTAICCTPTHYAGASNLLTDEDGQIDERLNALSSKYNALSEQLLKTYDEMNLVSKQQNEALQRKKQSLEQQVTEKNQTIDEITKERNKLQSCSAELREVLGLVGEENPEVIIPVFREAAAWAIQLFKYVHQRRPDAHETLNIEQLLNAVTLMVRGN